MSKDTVYREDAINAIEELRKEPHWLHDGDDYRVCGLSEAEYAIERLPSADRPQGEWLLKDKVFHCGCCGKESHFTADDVYVYDMPLPDFCEKCGARMKGADDES